jgi:DNA-directed RNA polymerase specialized sigma24 family protein
MNQPDRAEEVLLLREQILGAVYSSAVRQLGTNDAADAVSDTFTIVWQKWDSAPRDPERRIAWVFGILRNVIRREHEHRGTRAHMVNELRTRHDQTPQSHNTEDSSLNRIHGLEIYGQLSAADQALIELRLQPHLSELEQAGILGISHGAYRTRVSRLQTRITILTSDSQAVPR